MLTPSATRKTWLVRKDTRPEIKATQQLPENTKEQKTTLVVQQGQPLQRAPSRSDSRCRSNSYSCERSPRSIEMEEMPDRNQGSRSPSVRSIHEPATVIVQLTPKTSDPGMCQPTETKYRFGWRSDRHRRVAHLG
jgi:hypothetical protein